MGLNKSTNLLNILEWTSIKTFDWVEINYVDPDTGEILSLPKDILKKVGKTWSLEKLANFIKELPAKYTKEDIFIRTRDSSEYVYLVHKDKWEKIH